MPSTNPDQIPLLQWGRGLSTPEVTACYLSKKSIGLLQWGRGLSTPEVTAARTPSARRIGFNGAGVFRPRKCIPTKQNGELNMSFNGAGVFRPRKCAELVEQGISANGFNGAGVFRPRKYGPRRQTPARFESFNGAGVFRPRKCRHRRQDRRCGGWLQWGRGLSTPEVACAVTILFSKSLRRGCERRLARRASSLRTSIAPECNPLQALYIGRRERLCYFLRRSAARAPHRVTNTGYSSNSPSSVFASSRV